MVRWLAVMLLFGTDVLDRHFGVVMPLLGDCAKVRGNRGCKSLVEAGESAARVRRFKLRRRDRLDCSGLVFVRAAIEPTELVVERAFKAEVKPPFTRGDRLRERQSAALEGLVQFDSGLLALALPAFDDGTVYGQISGVQDDGRRCL